MKTKRISSTELKNIVKAEVKKVLVLESKKSPRHTRLEDFSESEIKDIVKSAFSRDFEGSPKYKKCVIDGNYVNVYVTVEDKEDFAEEELIDTIEKEILSNLDVYADVSIKY